MFLLVFGAWCRAFEKSWEIAILEGKNKVKLETKGRFGK